VTVLVRDARPDEYERIGELPVAAYRALAVDHLWGGYDEAILDVAQRAKHGEIIVAVHNDEVVGAVTFVADDASEWGEWLEPGEAQFRLLAVAPSARGLGAGRALAEECIRRAEARGMPIMIHTTPWMNVARAMYERMGFVRSPDRDVPQSVWDDPPVDGLPPEWTGQPFLAYFRR
jgi:GNAT superfamily N-acetyltransferase